MVYTLRIFLLATINLSLSRCELEPLEGDVRLVGSTVHSEDQPVVGRLDIYHNGTWGTISKSGWSKSASDTVCRQLGLSFTGQVSYKTFEHTEGKVWLQGTDLLCENNSTHIRGCKVNKWDCNGCRHVNDLAIACHAARLVGGPSVLEGRVEIFRKDIWGTVCDDRWDDTDAAVVCRQLDLSDRGTAVNKAEYGRGVGAILIDEAGCIGTEEYLDECTKGEWKKHDCTHQEDAGVKCQGVRLVGSDSHWSGRVLMFLNGTWGTVCGDGWDDTDATNVCQQLDLGNTGFAVEGSQFNESLTTWKAVVNCISNETSLRDCPRIEQLGQTNCPGGEDAGVFCSAVCSSQPCHNGAACIPESTGYKCACTLGYSGIRCEFSPSKNQTVCSSQPCHNGAACIPESTGYKCACTLGYSGIRCEFSPSKNQSSLFQVGVITGLAILTIAVIILSIVTIKQRTSSSSMQQPQQPQQPLGKMDSLVSYEVMGQSKAPVSNYVMRHNEPPSSDQAIYGNDAVSRRIVL